MSSLITNFFALISQTVTFLSIFFFDFSAVPAVTCVFRLEILNQLVTTVHILSAYHASRDDFCYIISSTVIRLRITVLVGRVNEAPWEDVSTRSAT